MLFSIIINNYNYGRYLAGAIESALGQTHRPLEVLVVDDGSTDDSREVIARYGERVKAVYKPNGGQNSACNVGWHAAKGDAALFLDSDDILLPDAIARCVQEFKRTDTVNVQFLLQQVDADLKKLDGVMPTYGLKGNDPRTDIALWGHYKTSPTSGNAYSRYFLDMVMPLPEPQPGDYDVPQDTYFAQLAGLMNKVVSIHEVLGLYRIHGKNLSDVGQVLSVRKLRYLFMRDYRREQIQIPWAKKIGFPCKPDRARFCPNVCKQRFLAYRLQPEGHPIKEDGWWYLLSAGLWGAMRFPYVTRKKRFFIAAGFLGIAFLPRALLAGMIGAVSKPEERKSFLKQMAFKKPAAVSPPD